MKVSEKKMGEWYAKFNHWEIPPEFDNGPWNREKIKGAAFILDKILPEKVKTEARERKIEQEPSND